MASKGDLPKSLEEQEEEAAEHVKLELPPVNDAALLSLQAKLLANPTLILLPGEAELRAKKRKGKDVPQTRHELIADAVLRSRALLVACQKEKDERQKVSPCYEAIQSTPIEAIAAGAIELLEAGAELKEAIADAVSLIEAHRYGMLVRAGGEPYQAGIATYLEAQTKHTEYLDYIESLPRPGYPPKGKGEGKRRKSRPRPMALEQLLAKLYPLPEYGGERRRQERRKRFVHLLKGFVREEHPDWNDEQVQSEALANYELYERHGVPYEVCRAAGLWAGIVEKERVHELHARSGAKGRARRDHLKKS